MNLWEGAADEVASLSEKNGYPRRAFVAMCFM